METSNDSPQKDPKVKTYMRFVLDPFQIFCIEKRPEYISKHPELKSFEITALLGQIWRNIKEDERYHYQVLAQKLQKNKTIVSRKYRKVESPDPGQNPSKSSSEGSEPDISNEIQIKGFKIPKIHVIDRNGFGLSISDLSLKVLQDQLQKK